MKRVVLLLSTYPFLEPRHGGQVRLANIAKAFQSAGWQVESLAIYEAENYESRAVGPRDIRFPISTPYRKFNGRDIPLINDLLTGLYAEASDGAFSKVFGKVPKNIDAIHVEQPWLWPLACKIKQLVCSNACLIYGSQNVESGLRRDIFESYRVEGADDVINEIAALEKRAASEADIAVAVTQSDLNTLIRWGAKRTVLAPNGISAWKAKAEKLGYWRKRLPRAPWALYVASAHPPNFTGFTACVGESLACIPPDSRLVVAGSVSEHLYQHLAATRWHSLNLSRLQLLYVLSDDDLAAVKTLAHLFLLPIPHGGGSNIKTAEAIYSGAYVIGTKAAFRGFEKFLDLPEVTVARQPNEFQAAIRDVLARPPARISSNREATQRRELLRWEQCLAPIPNAVATALEGGQPK